MAEDVQLLLTDSMKKWIEDLEVSEKGDIYKHVKDIDQGSQVISYGKLLKIFYNVQNKDKEKGNILNFIHAHAIIRQDIINRISTIRS